MARREVIRIDIIGHEQADTMGRGALLVYQIVCCRAATPMTPTWC
jgi:hypothetical protein